MSTKLLAGFDILVVEDESLLRKQIAAHLQAMGADVTDAGTLAAARQALAEFEFDFALLDVNLPDGKGTTLLEEKKFSTNTGVIVMTAEGGVAGAVEAMRLGALDYLVKPFEVEELSLVISRARKTKQAARIDEHRRETAASDTFFFGRSLRLIQQQLEKILAADRRMQEQLPPVLIEGETGTGKTTIARWLHQQGPRAQRRYPAGTDPGQSAVLHQQAEQGQRHLQVACTRQATGSCQRRDGDGRTRVWGVD